MLERVHLNAASLHSPSALYLDLQSENIKNIRTLVDSGSSDCFIDSRFAISNGLPLENLETPLHLSLFDGSSASQGRIIQFTNLLVTLPCGAQHPVRFLLTMLDRSAQAVLGYSWLYRHNPLIDWITHAVTFRSADLSPLPINTPCLAISIATPQLSDFSLSPATAGSPKASLFPDPSPSAELCAAAVSILISFVRTSALTFMAQLPSSHPQSIICSGIIDLEECFTHAANSSLNVSPLDDELAAEYASLKLLVPIIYHMFLDVFSKRKGTTLPPRHSHDHRIDLMDDATPPFGPIYSLSEVELLAL